MTPTDNIQPGTGSPLANDISKDNVLIVDWDGPSDQMNPRNWSTSRKWSSALSLSIFTFISPLSSSVVAPAVQQIAIEFNVHNSTVVSMMVSVFVLAYAVGPLVLGPLSEVYGRSRVLQLGNLFFLAWNLACGFAQNTGQLIAFRFLAGLGGSAPLSVGGGLLADLWIPEERGRAIGLYSLGPVLGPCVGPIAGAWIAQKTSWRWVFRATSIADGLVQLIGIMFLHETYAPILLERKAEDIRRKLDPERVNTCVIRTVYQSQEQNEYNSVFKLGVLLKKAISRPFTLFVQEPIIQLFGVYLAFTYGTVYLVLTTIPAIYANTYHQKTGIIGLHYIALGIGMVVAVQINSVLMDPVYKRLKTRNGGVGKPEYRLPVIIPGSFGLPVGLLLSGWSAQEHVHWILPDVGFALIGVGIVSTFQGMQAYVVDAFSMYAASALAAVSCFRSLAGFAFPLFAPKMNDALGYGKGDTILAAFGFAVGGPSLFLFWLYGEGMRNMRTHTRKEAKKDLAKMHEVIVNAEQV